MRCTCGFGFGPLQNAISLCLAASGKLSGAHGQATATSLYPNLCAGPYMGQRLGPSRRDPRQRVWRGQGTSGFCDGTWQAQCRSYGARRWRGADQSIITLPDAHGVTRVSNVVGVLQGRRALTFFWTQAIANWPSSRARAVGQTATVAAASGECYGRSYSCFASRFTAEDFRAFDLHRAKCCLAISRAASSLTQKTCVISRGHHGHS